MLGVAALEPGAHHVSVLPMSVVSGSRQMRVTEEEAPGARAARGEGVARGKGGGSGGRTRRGRGPGAARGAAPLLARGKGKGLQLPRDGEAGELVGGRGDLGVYHRKQQGGGDGRGVRGTAISTVCLRSDLDCPATLRVTSHKTRLSSRIHSHESQDSTVQPPSQSQVTSHDTPNGPQGSTGAPRALLLVARPLRGGPWPRGTGGVPAVYRRRTCTVRWATCTGRTSWDIRGVPGAYLRCALGHLHGEDERGRGRPPSRWR